MLPKSRRGMLERVNLASSPEPNFLLLNLWTGCYEKIVALVFEKNLKMSGYLYNIIYEKQKMSSTLLKSRRWFEHRTLRFFVSTLTNCNRMLYHLAIETTSHVHLVQLNLILNLPLTAYSPSFGVDSMLLCYPAVQSSCYRIINGNDAGAWRIISLSHTFMQDTTWSTTYSTHF